MSWWLTRREFIQGVALMILPHHRVWHRGKPPPPPPPPPSGPVFILSISKLRDGALLRAA